MFIFRAGRTQTIQFRLFDQALTLVNSKGERVLVPGDHYFIFSRGHGKEVRLLLTVQ
jgi:hypothetical protein